MQDSLTGNFCGNAMHSNTAVQEAQCGYYEESLQEKNTSGLGTQPDSRGPARTDCRPRAASESPSLSPTLSPSQPMSSSSSQMKKDELSVNPYECCPTQRFSIRVMTLGTNLNLTEGAKRSLLSLRSTRRHQVRIAHRLYVIKGWCSKGP